MNISLDKLIEIQKEIDDKIKENADYVKGYYEQYNNIRLENQYYYPDGFEYANNKTISLAN